ncbi:hypothetical protein P3389_34645, partial [Vibrio parahaemolyticus]|nr:hypothetical protein [Vibrio parahaemolyticus]
QSLFIHFPTNIQAKHLRFKSNSTTVNTPKKTTKSTIALSPEHFPLISVSSKTNSKTIPIECSEFHS